MFNSILSDNFRVSRLDRNINGLTARYAGQIITVSGLVKRNGYVSRFYSGDCSNNGVTYRKDLVECLFDTNGHDRFSDEEAKDVIVPILFAGQVQMATLHSLRIPGMWMAGGNYVYGDSSWPFCYPVSVHDRLES